MLKTWIRIPAVLAAALAIAFIGFAAEAAPVKLRLLHLNDVYEISPRDGQGGFAAGFGLMEFLEDAAHLARRLAALRKCRMEVSKVTRLTASCCLTRR